MSVRRSSLLGVRRILLTGMSGTGKSSALAELAKRGFEVVDTDEGGWSVWSNAVGGYVWDEGRIAALLAREEGSTLFVSGTVSNQGRFYPRFDAVVLLSAPVEVLLGSPRGRLTTTARVVRSAISSCVIWLRSNRCSAQPVPTTWTQHSRSKSSSSS